MVEGGNVGAVLICNSDEEPGLELFPEVDPMVGVEDESTGIMLFCNEGSEEPALEPRLKVEIVLGRDEEMIVGVPISSSNTGDSALEL